MSSLVVHPERSPSVPPSALASTGGKSHDITSSLTSYRACSLIELYPGFEAMLRKALVKIVGEKVENVVRIELAKDGSGVGGGWNSTSPSLVDRLTGLTAALCALVAMKQEGIASCSIAPVVQS